MSGRSERPTTSSLVEVLDRILDKGVVVDLRIRVSIAGIEVVTVELRIAVGSVDTFLHYATELSTLERATDDADGPGSTEPRPRRAGLRSYSHTGARDRSSEYSGRRPIVSRHPADRSRLGDRAIRSRRRTNRLRPSTHHTLTHAAVPLERTRPPYERRQPSIQRTSVRPPWPWTRRTSSIPPG